MNLPLSSSGSKPQDNWVICLCAQRCSQCRDYEATFLEVAVSLRGVRFAWLDIEDHADVMGDIDIETFPTLLVVTGNVLRFFGPLTPHAAVLTRLIQISLAAQEAQASHERPAGILANTEATLVWQKLQANPVWLKSLEVDAA